MKYSYSVTLQKPIEDVWKTYSHPETMYSWQPTLKSYFSVEEEGVDAKRIYEIDGNRVEYNQVNSPSPGEYQAEFTLESNQEKRYITDTFKAEGDGCVWVRTVKVNHKSVFKNLSAFFKKKEYLAQTKEKMELFKELISAK